VADQVIAGICKGASSLVMGDPETTTHPVFMGPVISQQARDGIIASYEAMIKAGGRALVAMRAVDGHEGWYVSPGVVEVDGFTKHADFKHGAGADVEVFGPLLRISVVNSLDEAIAQSNATNFGLAASIFTQDAAVAERFAREVKAGCINWNTGTAGASSKLPFGGLGHSGNHRPAGAFSVDYCAYPVAGMIERGNAALISPGMLME